MKIVFFGTSEFGAIILKKLVQAGYSPVLVVTTPDKPAGRKQVLTPPPVKVLAERYHLPVAQPVKLSLAKFDMSNLAKLSFEADLFVVAAYGKILPEEILGIPKYGTLNVHPSLLPKYRGASPIQTAILNSEDETGVTIILMDEKVDHGPILANSKFTLSSDRVPRRMTGQIPNSKITYSALHNILADIGAELLIKTIPDLVAGKTKPVPQDDSKATYTKIFKKEDGRIDWNKEARYIERQVRALCPWPGTFTTFKNRNLKILKASVLPLPENLAKLSFAKLSLAKFSPGTVFLTAEGKLAIQCGEDALLVEEVQLEGKKPMSSREFLLGHKAIINSTLDQV